MSSNSKSIIACGNFVNYIAMLEEAKVYVLKNFEEMDFENCDLYYDMKELVDSVISKYDTIIELCRVANVEMSYVVPTKYY